MTALTRGLSTLARLYGVQTAYYDLERRRQHAEPEVLLQVLRALGAPVGTWRDVPGALRERQAAPWRQGVEPVTVAWEGRPTSVEVRRPAASAAQPLTCHLTLETGETREWVATEAHVARTARADGADYVAQRLALPARLPTGYHQLRLSANGDDHDTLLICAPRRAYAQTPARNGAWGVFLPLYALRSARDWGCGDLRDLEGLVEWVAGLGGSMVATLPLLAAFLDTPFEPSPYAPASRLFWNELFVDPERAPELACSPAARRLLASRALQAERDELRHQRLVDYERVAALKRRVLSVLARRFFADDRTPPPEYARFVAANPRLDDYASFRAAGERFGSAWPTWPAGPRDGRLAAGDYAPEAHRYHLYVQWLMDQQLTALGARTRAWGARLYLDLPLGVHPDSYDVWRERDVFARDVAGGAPPDVFFRGGQNWGFPPLHPERIRAQGYRYFRACIQQHLRHAGVLRIDHVMGLHRLYWVPHGVPATDGLYVRYRADELYAILTLESHRHQTMLVGEDLGTVPGAVRVAMRRHRLRGMYVGQFEVRPDPAAPIRPVARGAVASLNTHDMYPYAAFWRGTDVADRQRLGILDDALAEREARTRDGIRHTLRTHVTQRSAGGPGAPGPPGEPDAAEECAVRDTLLAHLGASEAAVVLVNLEDLWLETEPQNVPGTWRERPNWRRKARYSLEEFSRLPAVAQPLQRLHALRTRQGGQHD